MENTKQQQTMKRDGEKIYFNNYTVSKPKQGIKVNLSFVLLLPGLPEGCPGYIWRNAARNIWITIQGKSRDLTEQAIRDLDGMEIDGSDLSKTFQPKRETKDPVTKAMSIFDKLSAEEMALVLKAKGIKI